MRNSREGVQSIMDFSKLDFGDRHLESFLASIGSPRTYQDFNSRVNSKFNNSLNKTRGPRIPDQIIDLYISIKVNKPNQIHYTKSDIMNLTEQEIKEWIDLVNGVLPPRYKLNPNSEDIKKRIYRILEFSGLTSDNTALYREVIGQTTVLDELCSFLEYKDLNNARVLAKIPEVDCKFDVVLDKPPKRVITFDKLNDRTYRLARHLESSGYIVTLVHAIKKKRYKDVEMLILKMPTYYPLDSPLEEMLNQDDPGFKTALNLISQAQDKSYLRSTYDYITKNMKNCIIDESEFNTLEEFLNISFERSCIGNVTSLIDDTSENLFDGDKYHKTYLWNLDRHQRLINAQDKNGNTLLLRAVSRETPSIKLINGLLFYSADPTIENNKGETVFDYQNLYPDINFLNLGLAGTCRYGYITTAEKLLDLGADVNYSDEYSGFFSAILHNRYDVVKLLLERGAVLSEENCSEIKFGVDMCPELVELLNSYGYTFTIL